MHCTSYGAMNVGENRASSYFACICIVHYSNTDCRFQITSSNPKGFN